MGGLYLGGNYWSDYTGNDTDGDALGDTSLPYNTNISSGGDYHPLVPLIKNLDTGEYFKTIQAAIDDADTDDGNTIEVGDGLFRENVIVNKSVKLINGSKPVVDGMGGTAFTIPVDGVVIDGFNITNSSYGINVTVLEFYIANNTINASVDGIHLFLHNISCNMGGSQTFTRGDSTIYNNTINATVNGIYMDAQYWGCNLSDNSVFDIGNFRIIKNNISCINGVNFSFTYGGCNMSDDASFMMGDFFFNDNAINSSGDGIHIMYVNNSCYLYDNSTVSVGNFTIQRNNITTTGDDAEGIYIVYGYSSCYIFNSSFALHGNIMIAHVNITTNGSSSDGIEVDEYMRNRV